MWVLGTKILILALQTATAFVIAVEKNRKEKDNI